MFKSPLLKKAHAGQRGHYDSSHDTDWASSVEGKKVFFQTHKLLPKGALFNKALEGIAAQYPAVAVIIDSILNVNVEENIPQDEYDEMIAKIEAIVRGDQNIQTVEQLGMEMTPAQLDRALMGGDFQTSFGESGAIADKFVTAIFRSTPII